MSPGCVTHLGSSSWWGEQAWKGPGGEDAVAAPGKKLGVSERGRAGGSLCVRYRVCAELRVSALCASSQDGGVGSRNSAAKVISFFWERGGDDHSVWGWQRFQEGAEHTGASAGYTPWGWHGHRPPPLCPFSPLAKDRLVDARMPIHMKLRDKVSFCLSPLSSLVYFAPWLFYFYLLWEHTFSENKVLKIHCLPESFPQFDNSVLKFEYCVPLITYEIK